MEHPESEIPSKLFDRALMRRMLLYVRPYRWRMLAAGLMIIPLALLANTLPLLFKHAIDQHLLPASGGAGADLRAHLAGLWRIAMFFVAAAGGAFVFRFGQGYIMSWIAQKIIFDMRADIFDKILRLPFRYFDRNPVGRLLTRVGSDVEAMQRLLTDGVVGLCADLITIVGVLGFMFYLSPRLALILIVLLPLLLAILTALNYKVRIAHRQVRQRQAALNAYLQEIITGMSTVQLFTREEPTRQRFEEFNGRLKEALLLSIKWFSLSFPASELLNGISVALVLGVGGYSMFRGDESITLGVVVAFLAYIRDLFRPLDDLSEKSNMFQSAMASAERVFGLMDTPEEIEDPPHPVRLKALRGEVEFDQVWFAYQGEDWVLRDVSVKIHPGESLAIVGATGAGKSSFISLIARFYDIQRGHVRVDGVDVRACPQQELRRCIGIVLQDPFIFAGTIHDNIALHNPALTREQVAQAARYVNAEGFIRNRPGGYDSTVRERGADLSTGQKQLLALARAIAQNPDILLILDEATANVDTETELLIQDALRKLMVGRTSIIIAHRLSTIRHVDRILVMRQGQVVEQGSHEALLRQGGYYRRLYDLLSHMPTH